MKKVLSVENWVHSFFIQVPFSVVHGLYRDIVEKVK